MQEKCMWMWIVLIFMRRTSNISSATSRPSTASIHKSLYFLYFFYCQKGTLPIPFYLRKCAKIYSNFLQSIKSITDKCDHTRLFYFYFMQFYTFEFELFQCVFCIFLTLNRNWHFVMTLRMFSICFYHLEIC